jgi:hypothetical protein
MKEIKTEIDDIDKLIAELRALKIRVARLEQQQLPEDRDRDTFKIGDRVRVKNRVCKPTNWPIDRHWSKPLERLATVTRITTERIYFTTDNGSLSWRHPKNTTRIAQDHTQGRTP